jgi:DNA segregation ATPase FtsK/SpoIIIE, S-DNA-T family
MELVDEASGPPGPMPPAGEIKLAAPPRRDPLQGGVATWLQFLFPVVGSLGAVLFVLVNPKPLFVAIGILFALSSIAMGVVMAIQQRIQQQRKTALERARYLTHLAQVRKRVRELGRSQLRTAQWRHPAPQALPALLRAGTRVWERREDEDDFLQVRIGAGKVPLAAALEVPASDGLPGGTDPVCAVAARQLVATHQALAGHPITLNLRRDRTVSIAGPRSAALGLARALLAQMAGLHSPSDVKLALLLRQSGLPEWDWCKWLPHLGGGRGEASPGVIVDELAHEQALAGWMATARLPGGQSRRGDPAGWRLVIADGVQVAEEALAAARHGEGVRIALIVLSELPVSGPNYFATHVRIAGERVTVESADRSRPTLSGAADHLGSHAAHALARHLFPLRPAAGAGQHLLAGEVALTDLLGIPDAAAVEPAERWRPNPLAERLRIPIGLDPRGEPVVLDLKEAALDGHGPHGLIIGATGSGKSELLRTIVSGLALTHHPEMLAFVLVDFKGGAAFAGLQALPHVAGMITNLSDDLAMVDRMHAAIFGEMARRQELLKAAGNLPSLREYHARGVASKLGPLPYLLVIVDEFGELLTAKPEFIDLFLALGRQGRSLGMHLLLSSQQLEEGRLRGLEGHLSYRIALRTFSAQESRTVIGSPDAYELPPVPGSGYLKVGTTVYTRFRAALASQVYTRPDPDAEERRPVVVTLLSRATDGISGPARTRASVAPSGSTTSPDQSSSLAHPLSVLDVLVRRLESAAKRVHQVWLPPLESDVPLDSVLGGLQADRWRGLVAAAVRLGNLEVVLGLVDRPQDQARSNLVLDMSGAGGHLVVVGGPQTGKSVLLRTLILSLALTHSPLEAQFYCIDYGGGGLVTLANLPHVGGVCARNEPERLRRTIAEVAALINEREREFQQLGIDSPEALRAARASGRLQGERYADVFLVIDNWPAIRPSFEDMEGVVQDIATRGLGYGLHLVITANRWLDVRAALRDAIGGRLELRLNEPAESAIDRRAAANIPRKLPGRGLTAEALHFQAALPRLDSRQTATELYRATEQIAERIKVAWLGPKAPPVRVLPSLVRIEDLPPSRVDARAVPIGISERDLEPVYLSFDREDPHFIIFGDRGSGKTNLLRTILRGLTAQHTSTQMQVILIDYRRTLLDVVPAKYLASYCGAARVAASQIDEAARVFRGRLPGPDVTVEQLRARNWWKGPVVYVVVDDYDLVAAPSGNPLYPLLDLLPQARDVGLHVLVARQSGGGARGVLEQVMLALRELGSPGLLLSGSSQEGPLLGTYRATPQPLGRGQLVTRSDVPVLVQVALTEESDGQSRTQVS